MSNFSRRRFLEDSMLATTAAITASTLGAGEAWAKDKPEDNKSPNDVMQVAVVGVRGRGRSHISAFATGETRIAYICDADEGVGRSRVKEIEKKYGYKPKFVQDMREVFDDQSVDIVSTATPNHWHALCSIWAMQAGKHVYVEKPVSHNVFEGRQIVEASRKYNKICQTGTQCRSTRGSNEAIQYVHDGKIGELKISRGLCYKRRGSIGKPGNYDVPNGVDYNLWCGPAPQRELRRPNLHYDWHWTWDYGNGDLGNQGIHQMDLCRWALKEDGLGKSVLSFGGRLGYEDAGETANTQVSIHDYGDRLLIFEVRGLETAPFKGAKVGCIFEGTEGYVVLTSYTGGAAFDLDGKLVKKFNGGGSHFGNFLDAVKSGNREDLNADILEGHLSSALCHLGNISYRLGSDIPMAEVRERVAETPNAEATGATLERVEEHLINNDLDLDKTKIQFGERLELQGESFVGSNADRANPMLTREYRAPFIVPTEV